MTTMLNPNRPLTEEERRAMAAMLQQSGHADQKAEMLNQLALAKELAGSSIKSDNAGGGTALGGFASALSKGLQGYMVGQSWDETNRGLADLRKEGVANRGILMNALYPQQQQSPLIPGMVPDEERWRTP